jgi:hypothetical protein
VVPAGNVDNEMFGGAMLLDIPPTSLNNLEQYAGFLIRKNADMSHVITEIGFDPEQTYQRLTFNVAGWVEDPAEYAAVVEAGKSDQVARMLESAVEDVTSEPAAALAGPKPAHLRASPLSVVRNETPDEPDEPVEAPKPTPPPPPVPPAEAPPPPAAAKAASPFAKRAAPAQAAPAPVSAQPRLMPQKAPVAPTVVQGAPASLEDEIDNLLAGN